MTTTDYKLTAEYHTIYNMWNSDTYQLEAKEEGGNWESIDRNQAVDEETGKAWYVEYALYRPEECYRSHLYTAEQIERFARTW